GLEEFGEVVGVEAPLDLLLMALEAGFEAAEGLAAALGVRIVAGEEVEPLVGLADQLADVLVDEGREGDLVDDLLGRLALQGGELRLRLPPDVDHPVEAGEHLRHPAGPELDDAAAQGRVTLEDAVEHHGPDEG